MLGFNALRDEIEAEIAHRFDSPAPLVGPTVVSYAAIERVLTEMRGGIGLLVLSILTASVLAFGLRRELLAMTVVNLLPLLLGAALLSLLGWPLDLGTLPVLVSRLHRPLRRSRHREPRSAVRPPPRPRAS